MSIRTLLAPAALALLSIASPATHAQAPTLMNNPFELEQQTHAALAQYYRWYQVYEVPFTATRIANQKDILADDVEIVSQMGTSKGKAGLEDRLRAFTGWQNAHHVKNAEVRRLADGRLQLEADILYQNIRPDQSQYSYTLHYSTRLAPRSNNLPVFERVELRPTGEVKEFRFEAAYAENRTKSLMHYWLYLIETAHLDSAKFAEILAPQFELFLSDGTRIADLNQLKQWLDSIGTRIQTSTHRPENFVLEELGEDNYRVRVDFVWKGIDRSGQWLGASTRHEWLLTNAKDERFARIRRMNITLLTPFQPITKQ